MANKGEEMKISMLDLQSHYASIRSEIDSAIKEVLDSTQFINGRFVENFEKKLAEYCRTSYAVGVSSGTDALLVSLMVAAIKQDDEVITTPYTFFATCGSIARVGAKTVFVDIDENYEINEKQIESKVTKKTKAIIPVHLFGRCANMEAIEIIAKRYNLAIIEDACQAIGSEHLGRRAGSIGHFGCFSFFPSKNLGAAGDAGAVTTNDEKLYKKLKVYREHGSFNRYQHEVVSGNFRIDALQAAILSVKIKYLDSWTAKRQQNAKLYDELFKDTSVRVTATDPRFKHIYNQYVIYLNNRDEVSEHLQKNEIACAVYYPSPLSCQPCFEHLGYKEGSLPNAELASKCTLALPIYPELTEEQIHFVAKKVLEVAK
jgi:dTDP-4-amino-4,6-dideoxygalactose transaminase